MTSNRARSEEAITDAEISGTVVLADDGKASEVPKARNACTIF